MNATGQSTQIDMNHWLLRIIAIIIDGVIVGIVAGIIWFIFTFAFLFIGLAAAFYGLFILGWGILWVIYAVILESAWGATVGKRILGLQVQTIRGSRPMVNQLIIRNISKIIPPLVILDWLIGIATPGDRRQKYLDRVAGTTVIQIGQPFASITNSPPPPPPPPSSV
jgi:uncharacterized RDD family membrane protein YckC